MAPIFSPGYWSIRAEAILIFSFWASPGAAAIMASSASRASKSRVSVPFSYSVVPVRVPRLPRMSISTQIEPVAGS